MSPNQFDLLAPGDNKSASSASPEDAASVPSDTPPGGLTEKQSMEQNEDVKDEVKDEVSPSEPESEVEDDFDSFMNEIGGMPVRGGPPKPSGLIRELSEAEKQAALMAAFEVKEVDVEWGSGPEQVDRILKLRGKDSPFEVFLLPPYANEDLIKKHYKKLSLLVHPDKCNHPDVKDAFHLVAKAYEELLKPEYRAKYVDVIEEAKAKVVKERREENRKRKAKGEDLLSMDEESIRQATIQRCDEIVKKREEMLKYAEETKKQNEMRNHRMEEERQAEEYKKSIDRKRWSQGRDVRVETWRESRTNVEKKRRMMRPEGTAPSEGYKRCWR